uniref:triacylglycerol lipase n=1 Tax=Yarrowia yakushimensis TaxID=1527289 RepID=A0A078BQL5_9ASCO|nr:lipase [Yarrowia yakushimensis]
MILLFLFLCFALSSPIGMDRFSDGVNRMIRGNAGAFESSETLGVSREFEQRLIRYMWFNNVAPCVPKKLQHPFKCIARGCKELGRQTELVDIFTHSRNLFDRTISGFVALDHKHKEILLVLRGTQDINDWVTDLHLRLVDLQPEHLGLTNLNCRNCQVDQGFLKGYLHSFHAVDSIVRRLIEKYPKYQLVITGHSLGGTAATLFGLHYQLHGSSPQVFSAGAPVLGNKQFANFADRVFWGSQNPNTLIVKENDIRFCRITHLGDFVPRFPFWKGYQQMSGEIFINDVRGIEPPRDALKRCNGQQNDKCSSGDQYRHLEMNFKPHSAYLVPGSECSFSGKGELTLGQIQAAKNTYQDTDTDTDIEAVLIPVVQLD